MTATQKSLLAFLAVFVISCALAAGGTIWVGLDGRVPVDMDIEGAMTKSAPVIVLWFMPGLLTLMYGSMALMALWERHYRRRTPVMLGEDALRDLGRFHTAFRFYMVAFGLLAIFLQAYSLFRAGGVAAPLGLDREGVVRLFFVCAGLLFAYAGNVTPKIPYVPNAAMDATRHYRTNRFAGWVFMLGGLGYAAIALILPFERLGDVGGVFVLTMIVLPFTRFAWAMLSHYRQKRWEEHEGIV